MHIVRLTVVGDKLTFYVPVFNPTSNLMTSKLHWNSVISTSGAKYTVVYGRNFYLGNPVSKHEYYKIELGLIPRDLIDKYNLMDKQISCFLYVRV